ncbi:MAG: hypothetical protein ABFR89_08110 [Actinomycetota bacterium]
MTQTALLRRFTPLAALVLLIAACSGTEAARPDTTLVESTSTTQVATTTEATTTTSPATTTTALSSTTTVASSSFEVTVVEDVPYLEMDGHEYVTDVYVPDGEGPWPVVVAFHAGAMFNWSPYIAVVAKAAAEAGMVVFAPNWVAEWPDPYVIGMEEMESWDPVFRCALAFAHQEAPMYGGDPNRTVVYGTSAGVHPAAHLVLDPTPDLASGCSAQTPPVAPIGAVLGDGEYFLHTTFYDAAFDTDPKGVQTIVQAIVDPASWPTDLSARFRFWVAERGTLPRTFDDPWDDDGWFAQRDPDGTIREDLDELGELDDGIISFIDEGFLLATRLQQAGVDVTIDIHPGGHTTSDKIPELVAYLLDAAGPE